MRDGEHGQNAQEPEEEQGKDSHPLRGHKGPTQSPDSCPSRTDGRTDGGSSSAGPMETLLRAVSRGQPCAELSRGNWQLIPAKLIKNTHGFNQHLHTAWRCSEAHLSRVLGTPPGGHQ